MTIETLNKLCVRWRSLQTTLLNSCIVPHKRNMRSLWSNEVENTTGDVEVIEEEDEEDYGF